MSSDYRVNSWLAIPKPNPNAVMRLFCFPYAGGNSAVYRGWSDIISPTIEICGVQIPGRGTRIHEKPYTDLRLLVSAVSSALQPCLDKPFALFGHSMGASLAFEFANLLERNYRMEPVHLFVSGCRAPRVPGHSPITYNLPEEEFLEHLRRLNGTPREVFEHAELMQLMVPLLRADFQLIQTYKYHETPPLDCPITAFGGIEDEEVTPKQVEPWREHTTRRFELHTLPGDHFFIHSKQQMLLRVLTRELYRYVGALISDNPQPR
jgi:medium-chain acyl-[acyl-carrier-protein] hydrolase